jgi:hypothetical protein
MKGVDHMKFLKIENSKVHFHTGDNLWKEIDKIDKESLLILLDKAIGSDFEMDEYEENSIGNKAHQIIYRHLHTKFTEILSNKTRFIDEANNLYKNAIEKYSNDTD